MKHSSTYRILIGGGGTGGHVFPAIAIADALKLLVPSVQFLFVGAVGKLEMEKVPEAGYAIEGLPVSGFHRSFTLRNITVVFRLVRSMGLSRRIIRRFDPHLAIGVGGYASGPIVKAAAKRGVPVLIQEQNSYAGVTNRLLSRWASTVCVAYENMDRYFPAEKIVLTGNPVRTELLELKKDRGEGLETFELEKDRNVVLVTGGSLGARTLNRSVMGGLDRFGKEGLQVLWQCGSSYFEEASNAVEGSGMKNIRVLPFIARMDLAYAVADLIVSRAGAITISELCLVGKPVILIPSPNVAEDHQTRNAEALVSRQAAWMLEDREAEEQLVDKIVDLISRPEQMKDMGEHLKQLAIRDASERIAAEAMKILEHS